MSFTGEKELRRAFTLRNGETVNIRALRASDFDSLWRMFSSLSEDSLQQIPPLSRELVERWVEYWDIDKSLQLVATVDEDGDERIIARATLVLGSQETTGHRAEFGVTVHDDYQNLGLGRELTRVMVDIARATGLRKVYLEVFPDNEVAIHVYERCGFQKEGLLRSHYRFEDVLKDVVYMGIIF